MKRHFEDDLQAFNANWWNLLIWRQNQVNDAIEALKSRDIDKAKKAIASDALIDALELVIEGGIRPFSFTSADGWWFTHDYYRHEN